MFENLSLSVKREHHSPPEDTLRDEEEVTGQVEVAEKQSTLYQVYTALTHNIAISSVLHGFVLWSNIHVL